MATRGATGGAADGDVVEAAAEEAGRGTESGLAVTGDRTPEPSPGGGGEDFETASVTTFAGPDGRGGRTGCRGGVKGGGVEGGGAVPVPTIVGIRFRAAGTDDAGRAAVAPSA